MKTTSINFGLLSLAVLLLYSCQGNKSKQDSVSSFPVYEETADMPEPEIFGLQENNLHSEEYNELVENNFKSTTTNPLSTFSIDVDHASYSNIRRLIKQNTKPEKGAVRIEEMINYFNYNYSNPKGKIPFALSTEVSECPWRKDNLLLRIGVQGKRIDYKDLKPSHLVFLIDTSGSMDSPNKLPLLIDSFKILLNNLHPNSRISLVTYAGSSNIVLENVSVKKSEIIYKALNQLQSQGGTNGANGIETAYKLANEYKIKNGNNRVILATDGDFNLGNTSRSGLLDLIKEKSKNNIFLSICGFGMGNYKDGTMEAISNRGNGNYFYIDSYQEAKKVFKKELTANLFVIAKDVKIQVEFNPNLIKEYRLIGYENRLLNEEDFNDDSKDAGELGAGHNVTALYELVPSNAKSQNSKVDALKYQTQRNGNNQKDLATLKLRYKDLDANSNKKIAKTIDANAVVSFSESSKNQKFIASVAGFGMMLRESKHKGNLNSNQLISWAKQGKGKDLEGERSELIDLIQQAKTWID